MSLISDLTAVANDILGVRDSIGAAIHLVYIVTRTWSGTEPGDGTATDVAAQVTPSPGIQDLSHKYRAIEAGQVKQGDLLLRHISKQTYSAESQINCVSGAANVEKFYRINGQLYSVVRVEEDYISWHVHIRRITA